MDLTGLSAFFIVSTVHSVNTCIYHCWYWSVWSLTEIMLVKFPHCKVHCPTLSILCSLAKGNFEISGQDSTALRFWLTNFYSLMKERGRILGGGCPFRDWAEVKVVKGCYEEGKRSRWLTGVVNNTASQILRSVSGRVVHSMLTCKSRRALLGLIVLIEESGWTGRLGRKCSRK